MKHLLRLNVNGADYELAVPAWRTLNDVLARFLGAHVRNGRPVPGRLAALPAPAADSAAGHDFFENKIRPLLIEHCLKCHDGAATDKPKGGLALDTRAGWEKGGEHGPLIKTTFFASQIFTPRTSITVRLCVKSILVNLYGFITAVTDDTPGNAANGFSRITSSGPITPMTVRSTPRLVCVFSPQCRIASSMCSIC